MTYRTTLIVLAAGKWWAQAPLWAQEGEADRALLPPAPVDVYRPPTPSERYHDFAVSTFGPLTGLELAWDAGIAQLDHTPPEWILGARGFGQRITDAFGRRLVQNTIQDGAAFALHEDVRYHACRCTGTWHRLGYALQSALTAKTADGGTTFAFSRFMGIYGSAMIQPLWYPARYSPAKDGFRSGNLILAGQFGMNIGSEFWPDIRRKLLHKR